MPDKFSPATLDSIRKLFNAGDVPGAQKAILAALKAGARHSSPDQKHGNQAMYHLVQAGFEVPDVSEATGTKSFAAAAHNMAAKCFEMGPADYAQGEAWDIADAAQALYGLANLTQGEISELRQPGAGADDVKDVSQLAQNMRGLLKFISDEIDEMEADAGLVATDEPDDGDAEQTAIGQAAEAALASKHHQRALAPTAGEALGRALISKAMTLNYVKGIGLSLDEQFLRDVVAVKSVGKDGITGYLALWGNPEKPDLELDYFTGKAQKNAPNPPTDFWDGAIAMPIPLTWNHGADRAALKATELIGSIQETWDDEVGRAYNAILNRSHAYRKMVDQIISERVAGTSSDTAGQYAIRQKSYSGAVWTQDSGDALWTATGRNPREKVPGASWIKQWPMFSAALTDIPAEPRMLEEGSPYWKSIGIANAVASAARTGAPSGGRLDSQLRQANRDLEMLELEFGNGPA